MDAATLQLGRLPSRDAVGIELTGQLAVGGRALLAVVAGFSIGLLPVHLDAVMLNRRIVRGVDWVGGSGNTVTQRHALCHVMELARLLISVVCRVVAKVQIRHILCPVALIVEIPPLVVAVGIM